MFMKFFVPLNLISRWVFIKTLGNEENAAKIFCQADNSKICSSSFKIKDFEVRKYFSKIH